MTIQSLIDEVDNTSQMYDLMRRISYSWFYTDYDNCKTYHFDPRSEALGEVPWATYDLVFDPEFEETARQMINESNDQIRSLSRQEKQDINEYWESIFTEVVDVNSQEIFVRIFENEEMLYLISFDGTVKLDSITDWK